MPRAWYIMRKEYARGRRVVYSSLSIMRRYSSRISWITRLPPALYRVPVNNFGRCISTDEHESINVLARAFATANKARPCVREIIISFFFFFCFFLSGCLNVKYIPMAKRRTKIRRNWDIRDINRWKYEKLAKPRAKTHEMRFASFLYLRFASPRSKRARDSVRRNLFRNKWRKSMPSIDEICIT